MGMLDENSLYNNLNVEKNQNNILKNIKIYNNSKNQNNIIPESSNYGSFTKNELNNEYLFARYPNGMINVLDTKGNTPKNETTNINLNSTIYKKANRNFDGHIIDTLYENPIVKNIGKLGSHSLSIYFIHFPIFYFILHYYKKYRTSYTDTNIITV